MSTAVLTMYNYYLILLTSSLSTIICWDLHSFNIKDDYYASSLAVYKGRTFLALPRSSCYNKLNYPTLLELAWIDDGDGDGEDLINKFANSLNLFKNRPYPKDQTWHTCKHLQDVVSIAVESYRGRLWILDRGNDVCQPKISIYNLHFNNLLITHKLHEGVSRFQLNAIVLDDWQHVTAAYIGDTTGDGNLMELTYKNANQLRIKVVKLTTNNFVPVSTKLMAIGRLEPLMYVSSDENKALFSVNLTDFRRARLTSKDPSIRFNATFIGYTLGKSSGLITDHKDGLIYYMIRDYAIMRWNTGKPLTAEYHDLLAQSYETLPYVSCFFNGPHNAVWALANPRRPQWCTDRNRTLQTDADHRPRLKKRIVKVMKDYEN